MMKETSAKPSIILRTYVANPAKHLLRRRRTHMSSSDCRDARSASARDRIIGPCENLQDEKRGKIA